MSFQLISRMFFSIDCLKEECYSKIVQLFSSCVNRRSYVKRSEIGRNSYSFDQMIEWFIVTQKSVHCSKKSCWLLSMLTVGVT